MIAAKAYREKGYAHLPGFLPPAVGRAFLFQLQSDLARGGVALASIRQESPLLRQAAIELYGYHYAPMITLLWGMTPAIRALVGHDLLPSYSYFRIYRRGDICRVHSDRPACEHSLSLTLAYSDDLPWALEIGAAHVAVPRAMADPDFGGAAHDAVEMAPGDAVLYQGVHRHHGRTTPNPNRWSAHLFLHWVDPAGSYADAAFDGREVPGAIDLLPA